MLDGSGRSNAFLIFSISILFCGDVKASPLRFHICQKIVLAGGAKVATPATELSLHRDRFNGFSRQRQCLLAQRLKEHTGQIALAEVRQNRDD